MASRLLSAKICRDYPGRLARKELYIRRSVEGDLMPEWLRVTFSDNGNEYFIDKRRDMSASAKIIRTASRSIAWIFCMKTK